MLLNMQCFFFIYFLTYSNVLVNARHITNGSSCRAAQVLRTVVRQSFLQHIDHDVSISVSLLIWPQLQGY